MGYSTSRLTLKAQIDAGNLTHLADGKGCRWLVPDGEAAKFAYKIREALYIARLYAKEYPQLANAAASFSIEVVNSTTVQARPVAQATEAVILTSAPTETPVSTSQAVVHGTEVARRPISSQGPQSEFTIIEAWKKAQPSNDPINFPQAELSNDQLTRLYSWCRGWKPPLMMMVGAAGITIGPVDPDVEEYAWHPQVTSTQEKE